MLVVGAAAALLLALVVVLVTQPFVRRLALRNAVRRPREAALVMLGCLLGTALVVGSAAVGDSFTKSVSDDTLASLGPVDAVVSFEDVASWRDGTRRLTNLRTPNVRAAAALAVVEVPMTAGASAAAPQARLLEMDYARAAALGRPADTGIRGRGPAPGRAWASPALAAELRLKAGDTVEVHGGRRLSLIVDRVSPPGVLTDFREAASGPKGNLLVAPGTLTQLAADSAAFPSIQYRALVAGPASASGAPSAPSAAVTRDLRRTLTAQLIGLNANVSTVKADRISEAETFGRSVRFFLTVIGSFGIAAGILLLINVFIMLAEERLTEFGTMRAVGLSRRPFVAAFSAEGCLYALVGAGLGGLAGLGLGRAMVGFAARSFRSDVATDAGLNISFSFTRSGLATGIAAGFLVSVIVVILTSVRISRMNVIRAIRVLPESPRAPSASRRGLAVAGVVAGTAAATAGWFIPNNELLVVGPMVSLACGGVLMRPRFSARTAITTAGVPIILWGGVLFTWVSNDRLIRPSTTVIIGLSLTTAGVLIANAQQAGVANLLRLPLGTRSGTTARLGLAYPVARRVRTALTVAPFALVIFTLTYTEGLSHLITNELRRVTPILGGDYQVFIDSNATNPFDFGQLATAPDVRHVAPTTTLITSVGRAGDRLRSFWPITAFDERFAAVNPPPIVDRPKGFSTDAAVYRAVAKDPDSVIVPTNFLFTRKGNLAPASSGKEPILAPRIGQTFTIYDVASEQAREVRVAAVSYSDVVGAGMFYGHDGAVQLFGNRIKPTSAFVAVRGNARAFERRIERAGAPHGVRATVVVDAGHDAAAFVGDLVNLYRSDLGIGLVVGVAGIGVVLIRSVRERNRQIGTLRAMGFEARQVSQSFLIEGAFVGLQGLTVGIGLGLLTLVSVSRTAAIRDIFGYYPPTPAPPVSIAVFGLALFAAALLASVGPARAASRIPPAVALRLVD